MKIENDSMITFDYTNMFGEGRLDIDEVKQYIEKYGQDIEKAVQAIRTEGVAKAHLSKDGLPEHVYFPRMPYAAEGNPNTPDSIRALMQFKNEFKKVDSVIFLGIGGSFLGAKTLYDCLAGRTWNTNKAQRSGFPKVYFSGNNLDAQDCTAIFNDIVHVSNYYKDRKGRKYRVMLVPISKSGTTLETMTSFLYFYEKLSANENVILHGAVVTDLESDEENSPLLQVAGKFNWPRFAIKEGIGGRFSVMTDPGLLLLAAIGGDIEEFLHGAREMDLYCQNASLEENPAFINALLKYLAYTKGIDQEVFMPYNMGLKSFAEWYVQLLAESLGKRYDREGNIINYGRTPIVAVGTTDMHAQTQMHQDGRRNKVVQFVEVANVDSKIVLHNSFPDIAVFEKYQGLNMHHALKVALDANANALTSDHRYNARFIMPRINEYYMGQLMYCLMLSIAYEGEMANVDAFDQPGVEVYKKYMKAELG